MEKINVFETNSERFLREKVEKVCKEYLNYAHEITSRELAPNRVITALGEKFGMSGQGIKNILMRKGIYKSAVEIEYCRSKFHIKPSVRRSDFSLRRLAVFY